MALNPSTDNYTLGKGKSYFNKLDQITGLYDGERALGNATDVVSNIALEKLDHYTSQGGLKAKDLVIVSEITPMLNFTLDEHSADNVALLYLADQSIISQVAQDDLTMALAAVKGSRFYDLGFRKIGVTALSYKNGVGDFAVGEGVSGAGGATATVLQVFATTATTGTLYVTGVTGIFVLDEALTGDVLGVAEVASLPALVDTALSVEDTDTPETFYALNVDYTIDSRSGRIGIIEGGSADGMNITVSYAVPETTYTLLKGIKQTTIEGFFRFVSDNPVGTQKELQIWRLSLTPTGDTAYIGDDWSTLAFEGEILKDESGHPDSPYLNIIMDN